MPTKNTNTNTASNKNNISINIDLDKSPKRKRPRKKPSPPPPEAPAVPMMPAAPQAWGISAYAPRPVTFAPSTQMIQPNNPFTPPAYFDKILTNQETAMNDLREAYKSELDDVRQMLLAQASHTGHIAGIENVLRRLADRFESETTLPSNPASSAGSAIHGGTSSSGSSGDGGDLTMRSATTYHDAASMMSWAPNVSAHGTIPVAQPAQTGGHAVIPNPPSVPSAPTGASGVGGGVSSGLPTAMSPPPPSINSLSSDHAETSSSSSGGGGGRLADEQSRVSQARSALSQALCNMPRRPEDTGASSSSGMFYDPSDPYPPDMPSVPENSTFSDMSSMFESMSVGGQSSGSRSSARSTARSSQSTATRRQTN